MPLLRWFFELSTKLTSSPFVPDVIESTTLRRVAMVPLMAAISSIVIMSMSGGALAEAPSANKGGFVAAGFGYQIGETSTITVKMYDPQTGDVLSDETFELHVKEEKGAKAGRSGERIFAGGVGVGATDLSNFVLRVYDAKTGAFQWEGQLNLTPVDGAGSGQMVSTLVPRQAVVTKVHRSETTGPQPSFLLRAIDPATGGLIWQDEFSTGEGRVAGIERIADRMEADIAQAFDFRIRMFDGRGQGVLWEDRFAQQEAEEESYETADEQAYMLPAWPRLAQPETAAQEI